MRFGNLYAASTGLLLCSVAFAPVQASGFSFQVLSNFNASRLYANPYAGVIEDASGNLYGTTYNGDGDGSEDGNVFELAPGGTLTDLHDFTGGNDGSDVQNDLLMDASGNIYSTTWGQDDGAGDGNVFEIAADGTFSVLYSFAGGSDGAHSGAGLMMDQSGNLYGTTYQGGGSGCGGGGGCGTVFRLAPDGTETVLHAFNGSDGANPLSRLIAGAGGNLYGTTSSGGGGGCGTIFRLAPDGSSFTTLWSFRDLRAKDGCYPNAGLVADASGNLYGTTIQGGAKDLGVVFRLAPNGAEKVLHAFSKKGQLGDNPVAALAIDAGGNLYGTTQHGGAKNSSFGTVFEITAGGTFSMLHAFANTDGQQPLADLYIDSSGDLFGTTSAGGTYDYGTVFELTPQK